MTAPTPNEKDIELIRTALAECKELYDDSTTDGHYKLLVAADEALSRIAQPTLDVEALKREAKAYVGRGHLAKILGEFIDHLAATGRLNASHTGEKTDE